LYLDGFDVMKSKINFKNKKLLFKYILIFLKKTTEIKKTLIQEYALTKSSMANKQYRNLIITILSRFAVGQALF
jgi:hypothetical protein